jgi:hypothetical protein
MPPEPKNRLFKDASSSLPPKLPAETNFPASAGRRLLAIFLSLFVGLFLVDAVISVTDDSLIYFANQHELTILRLLCGFVTLLATILVYILMAFSPAVPKQLFIPLTLFFPVTTLLGIPFTIFYFDRVELIAWLTSCLQVLVGFWILFRLKGRGKFGWPLVPAIWLAGPGFTWRNLIVFVLANIFGLLPAILVYLFFCTGVVVGHFSNGFMALHPTNFSVQARTYIRNDGKTIQLFPMSHVAETDFYQNILQTFPNRSVILMEGVTDEKNLLTNKISYKRMAQSLGLAEQHEEFVPSRGKIVRADIDVDQFSSNTIALLNLVMQIHAQGVNATNAQELLQYSPSPNLQNELFDDLLRKRNQHLFEEIQTNLPQTQYIIVPWGVAHMPGIEKEIEKSGFHLVKFDNYTVIRFFHPARDQAKHPAQ